MLKYKKATAELNKEHRAIKFMLEILEKIAGKLKRGKKIPVSHLEQSIEFIKVFADKCHHGKEEDLLFPSLIKAGLPAYGGPVNVMLMEHDIGRNFVKGMIEAAAAYKKTTGKKSSEKFAKNAVGYIELLRQHIDKEDNILFRMADMLLDDKKQSKLFKKFEEVEEKKIGRGEHEKFHKMLDEFEKIYL